MGVEEEMRGKKLQEKEKEKGLGMHCEGSADTFANLDGLLTKSENMDPNTIRFSLVERHVQGVLAACKQIYDEKKKPR